MWRDIQTVWIEKPDKDSSQIENRRPINLEEPGFKAYLNTLQEQLADELTTKWHHTTTGSIAFRSTIDSIMSVTTLIQKLIKNKQSFLLIYNDSTKAFDNVDSSKLAKTLREKLSNNTELSEQLILRLNIKQRRLCNRTKRPNYNTTYETRSPTRMPSEPSDFQHRHARNRARNEHKKKKLIRPNGYKNTLHLYIKRKCAKYAHNRTTPTHIRRRHIRNTRDKKPYSNTRFTKPHPGNPERIETTTKPKKDKDIDQVLWKGGTGENQTSYKKNNTRHSEHDRPLIYRKIPRMSNYIHRHIRSREQLQMCPSPKSIWENDKDMEIKGNTNQTEATNIRIYSYIGPNIWNRSTTILYDSITTYGKTKNATHKTYYKIPITYAASKQHRLKNQVEYPFLDINRYIKKTAVLAQCVLRTYAPRRPYNSGIWKSGVGTRRTKPNKLNTNYANSQRSSRIKRGTPREFKSSLHAQRYSGGYVLAQKPNKKRLNMRSKSQKHCRPNLGSKIRPTKQTTLCMRMHGSIRHTSKTCNTPMEQSRTNKSNKTNDHNKQVHIMQQVIQRHQTSNKNTHS